MPTLVKGGENPQVQQEPIARGGENPQMQQEPMVRAEENPQMQQEQLAAEQERLHTVNNSDGEKAVSSIATPIIVNQTVPVVVFVGPPSSGKSMILVRLAKYLRNQGYTIQTDSTFLNTQKYQRDCEEFKDKLNTNIALRGTVEFLLIKVFKEGREVAKLLEAPGEDFYTTDPIKIKDGKNNRIDPYLSTIMTSRNPKSYVVLLDLDSDVCFRNDSHHRDSYSQRFLEYFYPNIDVRRDRIILLYNKIDVTPFGTINGCTDPNGAKADAKIFYQQLFATMRVRSFGGFVTTDNFVFKTFCTGMFSKETDNNGKKYQTYNVAADIYPQELWKEITRRW